MTDRILQKVEKVENLVGFEQLEEADQEMLRAAFERGSLKDQALAKPKAAEEPPAAPPPPKVCLRCDVYFRSALKGGRRR